MAPDLDMRPGEPARSTLDQWLQVCRGCGTAAPDLAALPAAARDLPRDAAPPPFLRWARLCAALGDPAGQAEALLQGAWQADDRNDEAAATALRQQVAALWDGTQSLETALRRLDVLRRTGAFEAARAWAAVVGERRLDSTAQSILAFQITRIAVRDRGRYLISSALPPPAHAPHVTHGRPPLHAPAPPEGHQRRLGLIARLFRRS
jgi:hypothetical protein